MSGRRLHCRDRARRSAAGANRGRADDRARRRACDLSQLPALYPQARSTRAVGLCAAAWLRAGRAGLEKFRGLKRPRPPAPADGMRIRRTREHARTAKTRAGGRATAMPCRVTVSTPLAPPRHREIPTVARVSTTCTRAVFPVATPVSATMPFARELSLAATAARQADANERLPNRGRPRYIGYRRQQPKGGDPVSHCLSPRSPASVNWIFASAEVRAG